MKRRVFTRRRHAETKARRRLRLCAWLGVPATLTMIGLEMFVESGLPTTSTSAFAVVAIAYSTSVFKLHDLTGEWRFF
jgi:hypothetical protein